MQKSDPTEIPIRNDGKEKQLVKITNHLARQNVSLCWQCLTCSGGCPFADHMDLLPNQVIRLVQLGQVKEAIKCKTIWICVGCHTCSTNCPNSIDIGAIMDALRQLAIRYGVAIPEKDIFRFHKYIFGSIQRSGRLNKLEAMIQFKLGTGRVFSDIKSGIKMLNRGKLELIPQKIKDTGELDRILTHYDKRRRSFKAHE